MTPGRRRMEEQIQGTPSPLGYSRRRSRELHAPRVSSSLKSPRNGEEGRCRSVGRSSVFTVAPTTTGTGAPGFIIPEETSQCWRRSAIFALAARPRTGTGFRRSLGMYLPHTRPFLPIYLRNLSLESSGAVAWCNAPGQSENINNKI